MSEAEIHRNGALTDEAYWAASSHAALRLSPGQQSQFQHFFDTYLPKGNGGEALEIGACPGVHLAALAATRDYRPVALDLLPRVHELRKAFSDAGFPDVETIDADFLSWQTDRRFAVVMSLGFIEHFDDPADIIHRQWRLVEPGGHMVIGVPLFGSGQLWLRRRMMSSEMVESILAVHNLKAMDVSFLKDTCAALSEGQVLFGGAVWNMYTWFGLRESYIRPVGKLVLAAWKAAAILPRLLKWSHPAFSPYALFVVRRACPPCRGEIQPT